MGTVIPLPAGDITHIVQAGETLYSIAIAHHTTTDAIVARNGLPGTEAIVVGQALVIPVGQDVAAITPAPAKVAHTVRSGDTLSSLARQYRTSPAAIQKDNPQIADPEHLDVGMVLLIAPGVAPKVVTHVVRAGESISSIGRQYGVSPQALIQANGLSNPNRLSVGQVLIIP